MPTIHPREALFFPWRFRRAPIQTAADWAVSSIRMTGSTPSESAVGQEAAARERVTAVWSSRSTILSISRRRSRCGIRSSIFRSLVFRFGVFMGLLPDGRFDCRSC
jgi:hypothetical protein